MQCLFLLLFAYKVCTAHLSESLITSLQQHGQINSKGCVEPVNLEHQWELDEKLSEVCIPAPSQGTTSKDEPDSSTLILADLDRFSALLRQPPSVVIATDSKKKFTHLKRNSRSRRSYCYHKDTADDIKRTSSLYDISFTDLDLEDLDGISEGHEKPSVRDQSVASEVCCTTNRSESPLLASTTSATSFVFSESSVPRAEKDSAASFQDDVITEVTDLSQLLASSPESTQREEVLTNFMECLDRMSSPNEQVFEDQLIEFRERLDQREDELQITKNTKLGGGSDSGVGSIDQNQNGSGQPVWQCATTSTLSPSASVNSRHRCKSTETASCYPGKFGIHWSLIS